MNFEKNPNIATDMSGNRVHPSQKNDIEAGIPTIGIPNKNLEPKGQEMCGIACAAGTGLMLVLALLGSCVAYYVFCIMALIDDSHDSLQEKCSNTNIWPFILTVLILNLGVAKNTSGSGGDKNEPNIIGMFISIIVLVSLCTWGSVEFWNDCVQKKLSNTLIFTMVEITVYLQYCSIFLLFAIFIFIVRKTLNKK